MRRTWMGTWALAPIVLLASCAPATDVGVDLGPDTYAAWDVNGDNCLTESEFGVGWDSEFDAWDTDDTGFIEDDEWGVEVGVNDDEFGAFDTWDEDDDGLLSDDEFGAGSFGVFDDDDDDCIGVGEWNAGVGLWD